MLTGGVSSALAEHMLHMVWLQAQTGRPCSLLLQRLVKTGFKPTDSSTILNISLYAVFILSMRLNKLLEYRLACQDFCSIKKRVRQHLYWVILQMVVLRYTAILIAAHCDYICTFLWWGWNLNYIRDWIQSSLKFLFTIMIDHNLWVWHKNA